MPIGCKVTLREEKYTLIDRLISLALPRVRELRGVNPTHLMEEETMLLVSKNIFNFPEVEYDKVEQSERYGHYLRYNCKERDEEARELLKQFQDAIRQISTGGKFHG